MSYVQPQALQRYDKHIADDPIIMSVACEAGDAIALATDSTYGVKGILADSTDLTKLAVGFASKEVTAADVAASFTAAAAPGTPAYDRGLVTLFTRAVFRKHGGSAGTAQTPGSRVYLAGSSTAGATTTLTQPTTNAHAVQPLGEVAADGLGWIAKIGTALKFQTSGASVATF